MKCLGALLGHSSAFCQVAQTISWYPFIILGGDKHCESKVCCPRMQCNDPSQCLNPDHSIQSPHTNPRSTNLPNPADGFKRLAHVHVTIHVKKKQRPAIDVNRLYCSKQHLHFTNLVYFISSNLAKKKKCEAGIKNQLNFLLDRN